MDARDDLLLGVFANYDWSGIEQYAVSITRSGFAGRKVLLVWNLTQYTRDRLTDHGFELIDVPHANMSVTFAGEFFRHRDKLVAEYLAAHKNEFRFVFWMDIRDLIFQTDPSRWMEAHPHEIVIASESVRIKDEPCNDAWLKNSFTHETWMKVREHEVLNAGTLAGTPHALHRLFAHISAISDWTDEITEQAAMNVMLREPEFSSITHVPEMHEGFAVVGLGCNPGHAVYCWGQQQPELRDGVLYPKGSSEPFCIVHQYDRNPEWKPIISARYR